jgi:hypothetical protein
MAGGRSKLLFLLVSDSWCPPETEAETSALLDRLAVLKARYYARHIQGQSAPGSTTQDLYHCIECWELQREQQLMLMGAKRSTAKLLLLRGPADGRVTEIERWVKGSWKRHTAVQWGARQCVHL